MAKYNGYRKERKDYMMASLCIDLKNPDTGKIEQCVLLKSDLEAILRLTTYNDDANKLLDAFSYDTRRLIKDNLPGPINNKSFYISKKIREGKKEYTTINFIPAYKNNEDIFYVQSKEIINILKSNYSFNQSSFDGEGHFKPESIEIFNEIDSLITDKRTRKKIIDDYYEDGIGKNIEGNITFGQMVGILDKNIKTAIKYICKNPYKKLVLCSKLKRMYNKKLYSFNSNTKETEYKSKTIKRIIANDEFRYINLRDQIEANVNKFFNVEPEVIVEPEVVIPVSVYEEPIDETEQKLKQRILDASDEASKYYATNKLAEYYLTQEYSENLEELYKFSDLDGKEPLVNCKKKDK